MEKRDFTCVPNVVYSNRNKFLYGSVMQVNDINYFVPISSRVGKNPQYNLDIKTDDKKNRIKGALRFPYMIPVPTECLIKLDIKKVSDTNERAKISKELAFCRRNKDKIEKFAQKTYEDIVNLKNEKLVSNSCDFKLLEQAYIEYCIINKLECPQVSEQNKLSYIMNKAYTDFLQSELTNDTYNDFVTEYGEPPQTLDVAENRIKISKYIVETLNKEDVPEARRENLKKLKQAISDFEEPLFAEKVNTISKWADETIKKADERGIGPDEPTKDNYIR